MFSLSSNMMSQNAAGHVSANSMRLSKSVSALSSGRRIYSAAVDASGLAIAGALRADVATAKQSSRNAMDGISMIQTAEGGAGMLGKTLQNMKTIITQVTNGTYTDAQKSTMQRQFDQLASQLEAISGATTFNGHYLLMSGESIDIELGDGNTISIDTEGVSVGSVDIVADPGAAATAVDAAFDRLTSYRGALGSAANRLESAADVAAARGANIFAAESQITSTNYAKETAKNTSNMISVQMSIAAEVQANSLSKMVLRLLE